MDGRVELKYQVPSLVPVEEINKDADEEDIVDGITEFMCFLHGHQPCGFSETIMMVHIYVHAGQLSKSYFYQSDDEKHREMAYLLFRYFKQFFDAPCRQRARQILSEILTTRVPKVQLKRQLIIGDVKAPNGFHSLLCLWTLLVSQEEIRQHHAQSPDAARLIIADDAIIRYYQARIGRALRGLLTSSSTTSLTHWLKTILQKDKSTEEDTTELLIQAMLVQTSGQGQNLLSLDGLHEIEFWTVIRLHLGEGAVLLGDEVLGQARCNKLMVNFFALFFGRIGTIINPLRQVIQELGGPADAILRSRSDRTEFLGRKVFNRLGREPLKQEGLLTLAKMSVALNQEKYSEC